MAVSGDFFTIPGVRSIKESAQEDLKTIMSFQSLNLENLIQKVIEDINNKIEQLKTQERQFLDMFDCKDVQTFKNRVANYYNYTTIGNFTGKNLKKIVADFKAIHDEKTKLRQDYIERIVYNLLNNPQYSKNFSNDLLNAFKNDQVTEACAEEMVQMVVNVLSGAGLGKGGYLKVSPGKSFGGVGKTSDGHHVFEVAAHLTTSTFNKHLTDLYSIMKSGKVNKALVEQQLKNNIYYRNLSAEEQQLYLNGYIQTIKQRAQDLLRPIPVKTQISGARMTQTFSYKINSAIEMATGGRGIGTGKAVDIDSSLLKKANQEIQRAVVDELMSSVPDRDPMIKQFIEDRVSSMLTKDPTMFFVGHSSTMLEGILGEISAICALTMLLGDNYRPRVIRWIGSQTGKSGKKPSVDIAIREIGGIQFGIQIKNTTDELQDDFLHKIGFVDASIDLIFKKLNINPVNFENIFFADNFNVPYKIQGKEYVEKSGNTSFEHGGHFKAGTYYDYLKEDAAIDEVVADIYSYLMLFSSDFLYIGMDQGFESKLATLDTSILNAGGNYVYIVGSRVFFASEMLDQLQKDLQLLQDLRKINEMTDLKLSAFIEKQKGDSEDAYNIVNILNGGEKSKGNVSSHTVKMRSSWYFHN